MKYRGISIALVMAGLSTAAPAFANGYKSLETVATGNQTLIRCQGVQEPNPDPNATPGDCLVSNNNTATSGFTQQGTTTSAVVLNGTTVAYVDEVLYGQNSTTNYIIRQRVRINGTGSYTNSQGETEFFEINDIFRRGFNNTSNRSVAYTPPVNSGNNKSAGLWLAGFTGQGINEYPNSPYGLSPARNNNVINYRTDISAEDPDEDDRGRSTFFYTKFTTPGTVTPSQSANTVRVRQGGEEGQPEKNVTVAGYQPN